MLNLETLRKRALARLTALPELLYAFTRHWFLLVLCLGVGTGTMVAKVKTDPVVYRGSATLSLNSAAEGLAANLDRRSEAKDDGGRFFTSRVELLQNDSVLRKVVRELRAVNILRQDENTEVVEYGTVRRAINYVRQKLAEAQDFLEHPNRLDTSEDLLIQRAVGSFRRRTQVEPNPRTSTVRIHVFGSSRDAIPKELEKWIQAYRDRLVTMASESRDPFFDARERYWQKMEESALDALESFNKQHPDVSKAAQDLLLKQLFRAELELEDLRRERDSPQLRSLILPDNRQRDPKWEALHSRKLQLEQELIQQEVASGEKSDKANFLRFQIKGIDEELGKLASGPKSDDPEQRVTDLNEQIKKWSLEVESIRERYMTLSSLVEQKDRLVEDVQNTSKTRRDYQDSSQEWAEKIEAMKMVQVGTVDSPTVDFQPVNTYPHRQVLFGALGGLLMGVVLALLLELLSPKVRFKQDIYTEFGVAVIGVLPRR